MNFSWDLVGIFLMSPSLLKPNQSVYALTMTVEVEGHPVVPNLASFFSRQRHHGQRLVLKEVLNWLFEFQDFELIVFARARSFEIQFISRLKLAIALYIKPGRSKSNYTKRARVCDFNFQLCSGKKFVKLFSSFGSICLFFIVYFLT